MLSLNKVYNMDCLEGMKQLPDKFVDLLVTDPPFGLPGEEPIDMVMERLQEADRVCKQMIILMDWRNFWRVDALFHNKKVGELIWEYGWVSGGRAKAKCGYFPTHNTIGLYGDKSKFRFITGSIIKRQPGFSSPRQCSFANKTGHPYEKPIALINYLIENASEEGEIVMDCFSGSGTTLLSAQSLNRKYIGFEIEEKWYELIQTRLSNQPKPTNYKKLF